jgi:hypothetical protein
MTDEQVSIEQNIKVAALMSVPMCGWNPHWGCHTEALRPFDIPVQLAYGCWWDHGVSNVMDEFLETGVDWILAMDYDSMFTVRHLQHMIETLGARPDIDALAPLQCKRMQDVPLMTNVEWGDDGVEVGVEPIKVDTACFGLTLIRTDALRRMEKPWFMHIPDDKGGYGEGRVDPDIYFWRKWKECGNTLYVDPVASIGHLQPMVSEFVRENGLLVPKHVHWLDWRKKSKAKPQAEVPQEVAA